ncbi:hypothetical protein PAHAL_9G044100 [Panicum hallii]|uniref:Pheophorbide a oxygenase domain-containing protein n=1 Tax=Panicum hallii TaxID=206008 RepID=A0A2T8I035_9POAL|nr:hypothetical protein PAHAL_9G044100 [Panicum hallii]
MEGGNFQFKAPCTLQGTNPRKVNVDGEMEPWFMFVIFCAPVSPGRSRLIWLSQRGRTPTCSQNRIFDSDLYLLHIEERNFATVGLDNWYQACYVPTSSDGMVIAFRNWFRTYCKNQIIWATPQVDQLPSIQAKDELLDRYWSHVVQCRSCSAALKAMKALGVILQVASVAVIGFLALANGTLATSVVHRAVIVSAAKNFYFEDYVHAFK